MCRVSGDLVGTSGRCVEELNARLGRDFILRVSTGRCQDRWLCATGRKAGRKMEVRGVLIRVLEVRLQ